LEIGSWFWPRLVWTMTLLFYASCCNWDDRYVPPCRAFVHWDVVSETFCLDWPWTTILPISSSQVAKITGVSHQHPAYFILFAVLRFEQRALHLLGRQSPSWAPPPSRELFPDDERISSSESHNNLNFHAPNNTASKYMKRNLRKPKGEVHDSTSQLTFKTHYLHLFEKVVKAQCARFKQWCKPTWPKWQVTITGTLLQRAGDTEHSPRQPMAHILAMKQFSRYIKKI
jgi:hypothetical protein